MAYGIELQGLTKLPLSPSDAAKIASHLMLQEEWSDPINRALALYACCAYVEKPVPEPWRQPDPEEDPKAETVSRRAVSTDPHPGAVMAQTSRMLFRNSGDQVMQMVDGLIVVMRWRSVEQ